MYATTVPLAEAIEATKRSIDLAASTLLTKGYYERPDDGLSWRDVLVSGYELRTIAKRSAKENKRPFIEVRIGNSCIYIKFPKKKYLSPLSNMLMLVASTQSGSPVYHHARPATYWEFYINDIEFGRTFLKQFEVNPDFRKAVGLPT